MAAQRYCGVFRAPRPDRTIVELELEKGNEFSPGAGSGQGISPVRAGRSPRAPPGMKEQEQPSYKANLRSVPVCTAMKEEMRRMEPPGHCEPICDRGLGAI